MKNKSIQQKKPILLTDESAESSQAMLKLTWADVPFLLVPVESRGPVLLSASRTFRGLEGIERYIHEKKGLQA